MPDKTLTADDRTKLAEATGPLVSIVLPAYNAAKFLPRTLQSVLEQTYSSWELLVVDDGSDDETAAIAEEFASADPRITLLQQENRGVAAARNRGLRDSQGEFLAILDADDLWHPTKLAKQVRCLAEASERVGLVYAWSARIDQADRIVEYGPEIHATGEVFGPLLYRNFVGNGSTPLFRRECMATVGAFSDHRGSVNGQGCEDWDMYLRIAECFEFELVPEHLVGYRHLTASMSTNHESMCRSYDKMISDLTARHAQVPREVLAWSRSNFYLFLTGQSYAARDFATALRFAWRAVRHDREASMSPRMLLIVVKCCVRATLSVYRPPPPRTIAGFTDAELWPATAAPARAPQGLRALSPYGRIRRGRWEQLLAQPIPCRQPVPESKSEAAAP